jgi:hypothetical protein
MATTIAHQRIILEVQKQVEVLELELFILKNLSRDTVS